MKCGFRKIWLFHYLDGRLSLEEKKKLEAHLKSCSFCAQEWKDLEKVNSALKYLKPVEVSPDYELKFQHKLAQRLAKKEVFSFEVIFERIMAGIEGLRKVFVPQPVFLKIGVGIVFILGLVYFSQEWGKVGLPQIILAKGEVRSSFSGKIWQELREGKTLRRGAIISTGKGSFLDIELKGLWKIRIKEDSEVKLVDLSGRDKRIPTIVMVKSGKVLVDIGKGFKGREFKVETEQAKAVAYGTRFGIEVDPKKERMWLGVWEGIVGLENSQGKVLVKEGEKSLVFARERPSLPLALSKEEESVLREIEKIGRMIISLALKDTPYRVREFLAQPRFYTYGREPKELQEKLIKTMKVLNQALEKKEQRLHLKVVKDLEELAERYAYPELKVFLGGYYFWLDDLEKAEVVFKGIAEGYPAFVPFSYCALGIIAEKKGELKTAKEFYHRLIAEAPESLEAKEAQEALKKLTE
ncbi:MAG: FecR domain-containing protein [Candidatus Omnitrophica bacterium]|nr:FecR domain-containing protein [Candidatus Omnitrophota bacterium]